MPAVELDYLLGYGKSEAGTACAARARGVEAVKLLKKPFELLSRYRVSVVCESDLSPVVFYAEADADLAVRVTVIHGVAQEVVKDAL